MHPPIAAAVLTSQAVTVNGISTAPGAAITILQHASVPSEPNLYVLGSYEGRVTIHSQQIRALNLIYALKAAGKLNKTGARVAIVGGGIGGMMAAVAAAKLSANVTIFERHPDFLHNLRGCHTRHLHPNIYDWPNDISLKDQTDLPFMNWTAGTADAVATTLLTEWTTHVQENNIITYSSAVVMVRQQSADGSRRITIRRAKIDELDFDVVILAVGFGLERTVHPQSLRSYWRDDSLHQPEIEIRAAETEYLVSGNGDGGLIDVLRLRLSNFRHEDLIKDFSGRDRLNTAIAKLQEIEDEARNAISTGQDPSKVIFYEYNKLIVPSEFDDHLKSRLRFDTKVVFNYRDWPFVFSSSIFHRFLVSRLLKIDERLSVLPGHLIAVDGHEPNLLCRFKTDSGEISFKFDRVVLRHGPSSALARDFPLSNEKFEPILRARNALDSTRVPVWPDGFFGALRTTGMSDQTIGLGEIAVELRMQSSVEIKSIGKEARFLRDELLTGEVGGLREKLQLLQAEEREFLLGSLVDTAFVDERGLAALKLLLSATRFDGDLLSPIISRLAKDALFKNGVARKAKVLDLGPEALKLLDEEVSVAFFVDIFDLIDDDQFTAVNMIVPSLVDAAPAIPYVIGVRYVLTLLRQSKSSSRLGAPAARRGLRDAPDNLVAHFMLSIEKIILNDFSLRDVLKPFLSSVVNRRGDLRSPLVDDFLALPETEFELRHNGLA